MKDFDQMLYDYMRSDQCKALVERDCEFNPPVTLAYAIERFVVMHIKIWNLEDQTRNDKLADETIGRLKRRLDYLNGVVRPRLVEALGEILVQAVKRNDAGLIAEPNFKHFVERPPEINP